MFAEIDGETWFRIGGLEALTAGRGSQDQALFPNQNVGKIYDSRGIAGPVSAVAAFLSDRARIWESFAELSSLVWRTSRALYRNSLGSRVPFGCGLAGVAACFDNVCL